MYEITFNGSDKKVVAWLRTRGSLIRQSLMAAMEREMFKLRDYIVAYKLSGQILKNRTGTLRRSQFASVSETATSVIGKVATDPTARYGYVHEYGGTYSVKEHLRRGKPVRSHTVTFPERSYLRSSLRERAPGIVDALQASINRAVKE